MAAWTNIILMLTDQQNFDTIGAEGRDYMTTLVWDGLVRGARPSAIPFLRMRPAWTCAAMFTSIYGHNIGAYSSDY